MVDIEVERNELMSREVKKNFEQTKVEMMKLVHVSITESRSPMGQTDQGGKSSNQKRAAYWNNKTAPKLISQRLCGQCR